VVITSAVLGLLFEFPLILNVLIKVGVVEPTWLRSKRRHAIVLIFVFVALLPPTDGVSLLVMALPLLLMYEITLLINRRRPTLRSAALTTT
jgi:sec-independent protein translocase protein TatC